MKKSGENSTAMNGGHSLLIIGGSAGSLDVLLKFLPDIKERTNMAIVIVLHRKSSGDSTLVSLLTAKTNWNVTEAEEKSPVKPGNIYVAPPDYHLLIETDCTFSLDVSEKINFCRPSIDVTFECGAEVYGHRLACLLLSGANADGVEGLKLVKVNNGCIGVQDPEDAEITYMPEQAIRSVKVDFILRNHEIAGFINNL